MRGFAQDIAWGGERGEYEPFDRPVVSVFASEDYPDWPAVVDRLRAGVVANCLFVMRHSRNTTKLKRVFDHLGAEYIESPKIPGYSKNEMIAKMVKNGIITGGESKRTVAVWKLVSGKRIHEKLLPINLPSTGWINNWRDLEMIS